MSEAATTLDLFAGIGGFTLAFQRQGFTCIGLCEIEPHAQNVLRKHWPDTPLHADVRTLNGADHPADIITGGFPCQDLSVAGKRAGLDGTRSSLFHEIVRITREMEAATNGRHPKLVILENVPGLLSSNAGLDFAVVLESLVGGQVRNPADGWDNAGVAFGPRGAVEWRILDSQHFGVPQRRRRVFIVYHPGGERAGHVLFESGSMQGDTPSRSETREATTAQPRSSAARPSREIVGALTGGLGAGGPDAARAEAGWLIPEVARTVTAHGYRLDGDTETLIPVGLALRYDGVGPLDVSQTKAVAFAENSRGEVRLEGGHGQRTGTLNTGGGKPGQGTPVVAFAMRGRENGAVPEISGDKTSAIRGSSGGSTRDMIAFKASHFTRSKDGAPNTITPPLSADADRGDQDTLVSGGYAVRRLLPVECEALQAFPRDWTRHTNTGTEIADTNRYRMLGNAVTVSVAEWIAKRIANA